MPLSWVAAMAIRSGPSPTQWSARLVRCPALQPWKEEKYLTLINADKGDFLIHIDGRSFSGPRLRE